jgi:RhtB (resistance to homoserine/threonine) family protein
MYFQVFLVALLAAVSPGPDFFIVMKNSLGYGRYVGAASAIGIGSALGIHAAYTILGLGVIIRDAVVVFKAIQIAGAAYLAYLGVSAIAASFKTGGKGIDFDAGRGAGRAGAERSVSAEAAAAAVPAKTLAGGFRDGFLTNLLNPKAVVFFLSIFSQFIGADTPSWARWVYGAEVVVAVGGWFVFLAFGVSTGAVRGLYERGRAWIDRFFGVVLVALAGKIVASAVK